MANKMAERNRASVRDWAAQHPVPVMKSPAAKVPAGACPKCGGSGMVDHGSRECGQCDGTGKRLP